MTQVVLYIAHSDDGFIASPDGGVDWLPHPDDPDDTVEYHALIERIDCIVMGSKSYQQILTFGEWAWPNQDCYVFSHQTLECPSPRIAITELDVESFMHTIGQRYQMIWLLGGAELIQSFAKANLIDECILTHIPVSIGEGIPLKLPLSDFKLTKTKTCVEGITNNYYRKAS